MHVTVDWDLCESNALCEGIAPDVFSVGDDDQLTVHDEQVEGTERAVLEAAILTCPKQALRLTE